MRALVLIHRGNEDGMSGRWLEHRGRPVPGAGSRQETARQALVRAGVGEGRMTVEAGYCRWRKGPLLLVRFRRLRDEVIGHGPANTRENSDFPEKALP